MFRHSRVVLVPFALAIAVVLSACTGESPLSAETPPVATPSSESPSVAPQPQETIAPPSRNDYMDLVKQVLDDYEDPAQAVSLKGFTCMVDEISFDYHLTAEAYDKYLLLKQTIPSYEADTHVTTLEESPWLDTLQLRDFEVILDANPSICSGTRIHRISAVSPWVPPAGGGVEPDLSVPTEVPVTA